MRCVSFYPTKNYRLASIASFFRGSGYIVKQYHQVLHITTVSKKQDIFVFPYGCFVTWGLTHKEEKQLLEQLKPFFINPLPTTEARKFVYRYDKQVEMSSHTRFNVDIIVLDSDNVQLKLAISYGIAQSTQLESFEKSVQETIDQNSHYPQQLAKQGRIFLSQKEISRRKGQIFIARSNINLNSEFLSAPEYFREHPSFETYYNKGKKFLDIPRRVAALNQKLNVLHELLDMLTGQQQYRQSRMLQAIIILLILVELTINLASKML